MIKVKIEYLNTERYLNINNINYFSAQMENRTFFKMVNNEIIITSDTIDDLFKKNHFLEKQFIQTKIKETGLQTFINIKNISHITPQEKETLLLYMLNGEDIIISSDIDEFLRNFKNKSTLKN